MAPAERLGPADEKVTINVGPVDLGKVDLLVSEGIYASRTDFIRDSIRRQLDKHEAFVQEAVIKNHLNIGFTYLGRKDFEKMRARGQRIKLRVIGAVVLGNDITPELAESVVEHVTVLGSFRGPKDVIERLRARQETT
ncbi:MAG: CopG family transcriptional regulator [Actinomycetota bacterium]